MFNNLINLYFIILDSILNIFGYGPKLFSNFHFNDAPYPWQIGFQDPASPGFIGIFDLHDSIFFYLVLILFGVMWVLGAVIFVFSSTLNSISSKYLSHGTLIEVIWTITPALILMLIAQPSFSLLYILDEVISPTMTIKAVGHNTIFGLETDYETESGDVIEFDSYMLPADSLEVGQLRLLDVDNRINVPVDTHARIVVQSTDVIHDFAVPSLGIKIDAVPGRLNQTSLLAEREGTFYGQCSEICGVYHGFMPIAVDSLSVFEYLSWLSSMSLTIVSIRKTCLTTTR
uniref:cytochrome c oxidase subunit II n=1 Tax=Elmerina hispida TaxID=1245649 RepID=UPI003002E5BB|nr:cytochrome c oxidase subunit II [Elmerina hispida]